MVYMCILWIYIGVAAAEHTTWCTQKNESGCADLYIDIQSIRGNIPKNAKKRSYTLIYKVYVVVYPKMQGKEAVIYNRYT